jgi:hypothetical protein
LLRQVVDVSSSIALLAGWLASDDELRVAPRRVSLVRLARGGAGTGGGDGGGGAGDGGGGEMGGGVRGGDGPAGVVTVA